MSRPWHDIRPGFMTMFIPGLVIGFCLAAFLAWARYAPPSEDTYWIINTQVGPGTWKAIPTANSGLKCNDCWSTTNLETGLGIKGGSGWVAVELPEEGR